MKESIVFSFSSVFYRVSALLAESFFSLFFFLFSGLPYVAKEDPCWVEEDPCFFLLALVVVFLPPLLVLLLASLLLLLVAAPLTFMR